MTRKINYLLQIWRTRSSVSMWTRLPFLPSPETKMATRYEVDIKLYCTSFQRDPRLSTMASFSPIRASFLDVNENVNEAFKNATNTIIITSCFSTVMHAVQTNLHRRCKQSLSPATRLGRRPHKQFFIEDVNKVYLLLLA